jgi:sugar lactone lactonase YvrE
MRPLRTAGAVLGVAALLACAPAALAVPDCETPLPPATTVLDGQGSLESVIVDGRGRLFYTDTTAKALMRLDRPGATPVPVKGGIDALGGLAFDADGTHLFVGQGDSLVGGLTGNLQPAASLLRIDVDTGATTVFATGLRMANGLARAADGTLFASSDLGASLDRIGPDGTLTRDWASVFSGNGLAIDSAQTGLFVNQTLAPAAIARVDLDKPAKVTTFFRATGADVVAGLDGMTIDPSDRLVVAANLTGQVWRVGTDAAACALARGLTNTSAVAYGHGAEGFSEGRLFAVGFDGKVVEVPAGRLPAGTPPPGLVDGPAPAARISLAPASARVRGGRVRLAFHVRVGKRLVAARLRIGTRTVRTGRTVTLRVAPKARTLRVRFSVAGRAYTRTVTLRR